MFKRTKIQTILKNATEDKKVEIFGWVKSKRESKSCTFIVINDGSMHSDFQCVVDNTSNIPKDVLSSVSTGCALKLIGALKKSPGAGQAWELNTHDISILGHSPVESYPLQKKGHSLEFLREIGHLRGRTNTFNAVYRIRSFLAFKIHEFFTSRGFYWVHTPIITASDCEGAGAMFRVTTLDLQKIPKTDAGKIDFSKDFFGKEAHLTVSGQLEGEALAHGLGDIYTFGPTFRAENSNTTRHLSEFWMIEPEMAFADLDDNMNLAEDFLKFLCKGVASEFPGEIQFLAKHYEGTSLERISQLAESNFQRITYTEAVDILLKCNKNFEFPVKWGIDLQSEHERFISDEVVKGPVIVYNYPKDIKAFYMRQNDDGKTVAAMDVLAPKIGEIIGGSQREERLDRLENRIKELNLPIEELQWYLDLRRFGGTPHAGFGLGFERLIQYITGMGNIRDVIPFPRAPQSISF